MKGVFAVLLFALLAALAVAAPAGDVADDPVTTLLDTLGDIRKEIADEQEAANEAFDKAIADCTGKVKSDEQEVERARNSEEELKIELGQKRGELEDTTEEEKRQAELSATALRNQQGKVSEISEKNKARAAAKQVSADQEADYREVIEVVAQLKQRLAASALGNGADDEDGDSEDGDADSLLQMQSTALLARLHRVGSAASLLRATKQALASGRGDELAALVDKLADKLAANLEALLQTEADAAADWVKLKKLLDDECDEYKKQNEEAQARILQLRGKAAQLRSSIATLEADVSNAGELKKAAIATLAAQRKHCVHIKKAHTSESATRTEELGTVSSLEDHVADKLAAAVDSMKKPAEA